MAMRPKRPCKYPGCSELVIEGYCDKHKRIKNQQIERERRTSSQRGYDSRWQRYREKFLKDHPLCVDCLKAEKVIAATDVDHIIPHKGNKELFWDPNNHQALCHSCHSKKTAEEDGGFGNAY